MKLYCLVGLFFLGVATCRTIDNNPIDFDNIEKTNQLDDNPSKLDENNTEDRWAIDPASIAIVIRKCKEVGGEVAVKKLMLSTEKSSRCLNNEVPKIQSELRKEFDDEECDSDSICSNRRKALRSCFVDVIDAIKDCSREEEKYTPDFLFDAIDAFLDYVCADHGKFVNEVMNANETDKCFEHIIEKIFSENMTYVCTNNFKLLNTDEDDIITKPALCNDLNSAKICYSAYLTRECPAATALNKFFVGIFNAISSPCKDTPIISTLPAILNKPAGSLV